MTWYELSPERLVLEVLRVRSTGRPFTLLRHNGFLAWQGSVSALPPGIQASPLEFRIKYSNIFPAFAPWVEIVSPQISGGLVGHEWHRLADGDVCYIRPSLWNIRTTADEIITKVEDWYFNFVAKQNGLIAQFPDTGRATIKA